MANSREGAFQAFYQGLLMKGMEPAMARLTLAQKIVAITLVLWKKRAPGSLQLLGHVRANVVTGDPPDPCPSSLCASPSFPASSASIWPVGQVSGRR
jgi:hypothetical protein